MLLLAGANLVPRSYTWLPPPPPPRPAQPRQGSESEPCLSSAGILGPTTLGSAGNNILYTLDCVLCSVYTVTRPLPIIS